MTDFVTITCYRCDEEFGMAPDSYAHLRRSSQSFWCPNGHSQHFPLGPTEAEKLRQERDRLKQNAARLIEQRDRAERSASAYKGQATRLRRRAKAGVCPCCNRHFEQLERHMQTKHPSFEPEEKVDG